MATAVHVYQGQGCSRALNSFLYHFKTNYMELSFKLVPPPFIFMP